MHCSDECVQVMRFYTKAVVLLTPSVEQCCVTLSVKAVLGQAAVRVSSPHAWVQQVFAWRQDARWLNNEATAITRRSHVHSAEPPGGKNRNSLGKKNKTIYLESCPRNK